MSTLQCANIHLESTANNRLQYLGTNTVAVVVGGTNNFVANTTTTTLVSGSAVNLLANSSVTSLQVNGANSLVANSTATQLTVGATALLTVNSTAANVSSNTLNLGTFTAASNGYTYLPNGLKMNWGMVAAANTAAGTTATFTSAFSTAVYAITATVQSTAMRSNQAAVVVSSSTTGANLSCGNTSASGTNVYFMAIGI